MRVIVTQRQSMGSHGGPIDSLEREYVDFLVRAGFEVYPVSNFTADVAAFVQTVQPDLVMLTGGGIVQAQAYRYEVAGAHQPERDRMEDELVGAALERGVPVCGICRGMHKLNAYFGGSVSSFDGVCVPRPVRACHPVELADGSCMRFDVNNYHKDGMFAQDLGAGLTVLATDPENGTIEAFCHAAKKVLAVQWHPERMDVSERGRAWFEQALYSLVGTR